MLFLLLAIFSSALISCMMRVSEAHTQHKLSLLACNYAVCSLLAALDGGQPLASADGPGTVILLGVVSGVLYLAAFVLLQWNIGRNGVTLPATFMKLGVLVPTSMALTLFHEAPKPTQLWGILLAVAAICLIQSGGKSGQVQSRWGLPLLLLAGGLADAMSKIYDVYGEPTLQGRYLFFTFGVALLLCLILCLVRREGLSPMDALFGAMVGVPNYFSSRFLLLSLQKVPAVAAYPTFSVGTIVLVTLTGWLLFRERLTRRQLLSLGLILCALVLLNL